MRYTVTIETQVDSGIMYHNLTLEANDRVEALAKAGTILDCVAGNLSNIHIASVPSIKETEKPYRKTPRDE